MTTTPEAAGTTADTPQLLKGIGRINGDGFKDTTRKGEVVFVYAQQFPEPYAPGQYPRVGNTIYGASIEQYDFVPAAVEEVRDFIEARITASDAEVARLKNVLNDLGKIIHDMTVAQQAAWIEWRHGKGAEEGMVWIQNGLAGPGFIPDEDEPYGKEAQAWFDANCAAPLPTCFCGRPSNIGWIGQGFCC